MSSDLETYPQVHVVANAHIDPVWIWDWREGMHEVLQTFRSALERLDEDPALIFTASSSAHYEWVQRTDPRLFEQIRKAVVAGRWVVTGGQWIEPDCNIPAGESVCRQFLYGQRYLAEHLGTIASVGYNVDSFGHSGSLPQLLVNSGIEAYVMMRPDENEKLIDSHTFCWEGSDGTRIQTYRIPFGYSTRGHPEESIIRQRAAALLELSTRTRMPLMLFVGLGDHGGGPTRVAIRCVHDVEAETGGEVRFSSPVNYFDALKTTVAQSADTHSYEAEGAGKTCLGIVHGELQWHAVGCFSAHSAIKRENARAEQALQCADAMISLCRALTGRDLRAGSALRDAWRSVLFAQFHDSLGGTCTQRAYSGIFSKLSHAVAVADELCTAATHSIVQNVDTWVDAAENADGLESASPSLPLPFVVFNPLGWELTAPVSIPYPVAVAVDDDGVARPTQQLPSGEVTHSPTCSLFQVTVPPLGYRRYWLRVEEDEADKKLVVDRAEANAAGVMDNGMVRLLVDRQTGAITSLMAVGREWISEGGISPVVIDDSSDTWSHGIARYDGAEQGCEVLDIALLENGPVRSTYRTWFGWGNSTITQDVSVYQGHQFVEVRYTVDWHDAGSLVKILVPLALSDVTSAAGAPYGTAERDCSGHEEAMVHWVDLYDRGGRGGLACTADYKYGYDALGGRLRLTALRSPRFADHGAGWAKDDPEGYPVTDQGRQQFSYRLHPHGHSWAEAQLWRRAYEHVTDPPVVLDTWHKGELGPRASLLQVESGTAIVPAVKRAEDETGTVIRLWEVTGTATLSAGSFPLQGRRWEEELRPHELRTIYVPDDPAAPVREIDIPELGLPPTSTARERGGR